MTQIDQLPATDQITWRDGVPISTLYGDPFFSLDDGLAETEHVFLNGNDLPARLCDGFHIAELGFGTGLNVLVLWRAWLRTGRVGQIRVTTFEAHPMPLAQMETAHAAFAQLSDLATQLRDAWGKGQRQMALPGLQLEVIEGDARNTLPGWSGAAEAWFLDGFSPARNPQLWSGEMMQQVARHTSRGGTFATYSAAGHIRRALAAAGFDVSRTAGFGRKRHMSRGVLR